MGTHTRKDALRSRRAILDAAEQLLAERPDASFAEIAHAAGVGQATVYRHFHTRQALHLAHGEESVRRMAEGVATAPVGADSFERLLRTFVSEQVRFQGLAAAIRRGEVDEEGVVRLNEAIKDMFAAPLAAALGAGVVRADLTTDDALMVLGMVDGPLAGVTDEREREQVAARTLALVLDGLR
jgi:AcrR family transcriptional regulator